MATKEKKTRISGKKSLEKDIAATYNEFKEWEGRQYTGMKIGRSHKWYYDKGVWKEKKITPDKWQINYGVNKRRAGKAPEGSGAAVGTGYHWYILSHQNVTKIDANTYSTSMTGLKYKLAHRRPGQEKWSTTSATQRKHLVKILRELADELERTPLTMENQKGTSSAKRVTAKKHSARKKAAIANEELVEA